MKRAETQCPITRQMCMQDCEWLNTVGECMVFEGLDALIRIANALEERNEQPNE